MYFEQGHIDYIVSNIPALVSGDETAVGLVTKYISKAWVKAVAGRQNSTMPLIHELMSFIQNYNDRLVVLELMFKFNTDLPLYVRRPNYSSVGFAEFWANENNYRFAANAKEFHEREKKYMEEFENFVTFMTESDTSRYSDFEASSFITNRLEMYYFDLKEVFYNILPNPRFRKIPDFIYNEEKFEMFLTFLGAWKKSKLHEFNDAFLRTRLELKDSWVAAGIFGSIHMITGAIINSIEYDYDFLKKSILEYELFYLVSLRGDQIREEIMLNATLGNTRDYYQGDPFTEYKRLFSKEDRCLYCKQVLLRSSSSPELFIRAICEIDPAPVSVMPFGIKMADLVSYFSNVEIKSPRMLISKAERADYLTRQGLTNILLSATRSDQGVYAEMRQFVLDFHANREIISITYKMFMQILFTTSYDQVQFFGSPRNYNFLYKLLAVFKASDIQEILEIFKVSIHFLLTDHEYNYKLKTVVLILNIERMLRKEPFDTEFSSSINETATKYIKENPKPTNIMASPFVF